jgi:hypothetical protein
MTGMSMLSEFATLMHKSLTEANLSIEIKQIPQQYGKSNSAAQDDEKNTAPHSKTTKSRKNTKEKIRSM